MVKLKLSNQTLQVCLLVIFTIVIKASSDRAESSTARAQPNRNFIHIQLQSHHHQQQPHHGHRATGDQRLNSNNNSPSSFRYSGSDALQTNGDAVTSSSVSYSNPSGLPDDALILGSAASQSQQQLPQQQIFINQSNNIYILAKYGQTVYLPCIVFKQKHLDLSNVHVIWHRLYERSRPIVLSIGLQQLKQDMRYRVKVLSLNRPKASTMMFDEPLVFGLDNSEHNGGGGGGGIGAGSVDYAAATSDELSNVNELADKSMTAASTQTTSTASSHADLKNNDYLIQNWQFEIRKLTFDDAGTYQCLLPLVKPISKNITLQVIPDLTIEPKEGQYKIDDKIVLKCRATMRSLHKAQSPHLIHQRQSKSSILWYKENEIIKSSSSGSATSSSSKSASVRSEKVATENSGGDARDDSSTSSIGSSNDGGSDEQRKVEIETKLDTNEQTLNSILTINHAREDDSGKYRCIYDNIQEQINIKVINDHYEYKNYISSMNAATRSISSPALFIFLFIQLVLFHRLVREN